MGVRPAPSSHHGIIRDLSTAVGATEVLRGAPRVYVDYDEVAHHVGIPP